MSFEVTTALWLDTSSQPIASAAVGDTVAFVAFAETSGAETGGTITINSSPNGFLPLEWGRTPAATTTGSSPPIITAAGATISVGDTSTIPTYGYPGLFYFVSGVVTTPGTKTFNVTFDTAQSTALSLNATLTVTGTESVDATFNPGLPLTCQTGVVGWTPDVSSGVLTFVDSANYTIPNYCVRFTAGAAFELHVATMEGEDIDTITQRIAYPRRERIRTARIACQMLFGTNKAGTAYDSLQEGLTRNWAEITALSDLSQTTINGLQTVQYTPYVGSPTYQFEAHVLPPVTGEVEMGVGMAFGLIIEVPNPAASLP